MKKITNSSKVSINQYSINKQEIIDALSGVRALPLAKGETITKVFFQVPGGGDYSNMRVEIEDYDDGLIIETETEFEY